MKNLAHRGYSALYPENTMEAFIKAYEKGFDGVETDVHLSKDGEMVLIHDEKVDRTSNGKGYVKDYTLSQLRQFDYSYKFKGKHDIPTLKELLEFIKGKDFYVNIEIKSDIIHYDDIEEKVMKLVQEMGVEKQIYYSSFYLPSILKIKQMDEKAYVGYLMEHKYSIKRMELEENHITAFHPKYTFLTQKRIQELKENNIIIATWTVPSLKKYQRLTKLGVDIIISNEYFK